MDKHRRFVRGKAWEAQGLVKSFATCVSSAVLLVSTSIIPKYGNRPLRQQPLTYSSCNRTKGRKLHPFPASLHQQQLFINHHVAALDLVSCVRPEPTTICPICLLVSRPPSVQPTDCSFASSEFESLIPALIGSSQSCDTMTGRRGSGDGK